MSRPDSSNPPVFGRLRAAPGRQGLIITPVIPKLYAKRPVAVTPGPVIQARSPESQASPTARLSNRLNLRQSCRLLCQF